MATIAFYLQQMDYNRTRTLGTFDEIAGLADPQATLAFRPAPGRAHIAWQFAHLAISEELFATERLFGQTPAYSDLVPRFRSGSTPDDDIPSVALIRELLTETRVHLRNALASFTDQDLGVIPEWVRDRGWTLERVLQIICWHEPHHQGQAHISLNIWKNAQRPA